MTEKPKRKQKNATRLSWNAIGCSLMFVMGACVLSLLSYMLLYTSLVDSCEVFISDTNGYSTHMLRRAGEDYLKYETTRNGGATWITFYEVNDSAPIQTDCDAFHVLNETTYWVVPDEVYSPRIMFVTHDAGETWHEWSADDVAGLSHGCTIEELDFDLTNGSMIVECGISNSGRYPEEFQNYSLFSTDGGITWNIAND